MSGRLLFMLTLWMAISVALLSALTPLGPPASKITGSAFNPATTDVVLKARALSIPLGERVSASGDNDSMPPVTSVIPWLVFATAMLAVAWLFRPLPAASPAIAERVQICVRNGFHARAPPALI